MTRKNGLRDRRVYNSLWNARGPSGEEGRRMRRPYDRRAGEKKEKEGAGLTLDVTGRRGELFEPRHASRLTLTSQCEKGPPSNAASGKSAGTGHDAQRDTKRHRKVVRRHSLRPPPAESPAHFDSIARRRRDHIRLGSLDRIHAPVSGTDPCGAVHLAARGLHIDCRVFRPSAPSADSWGAGTKRSTGAAFRRERAGERSRFPAMRESDEPTAPTERRTVRNQLCNQGKQGPPIEATAWSATETETEARGTLSIDPACRPARKERNERWRQKTTSID